MESSVSRGSSCIVVLVCITAEDCMNVHKNAKCAWMCKQCVNHDSVVKCSELAVACKLMYVCVLGYVRRFVCLAWYITQWLSVDMVA